MRSTECPSGEVKCEFLVLSNLSVYWTSSRGMRSTECPSGDVKCEFLV